MKLKIALFILTFSILAFANDQEIIKACQRSDVAYPALAKGINACIKSGATVEAITACRRADIGNASLGTNTLACILSGASPATIAACRKSDISSPALGKPEDILTCIALKASPSAIESCRKTYKKEEVMKCITGELASGGGEITNLDQVITSQDCEKIKDKSLKEDCEIMVKQMSFEEKIDKKPDSTCDVKHGVEINCPEGTYQFVGFKNSKIFDNLKRTDTKKMPDYDSGSSDKSTPSSTVEK